MAVIKVPTGILRLICIVLFIASLLTLLSYVYFYFDDEPDYLADAFPLNFALYFAFCVLGAGLITWIFNFMVGLFSSAPSDGSSTYYNSRYSGGGGASGDW